MPRKKTIQDKQYLIFSFKKSRDFEDNYEYELIFSKQPDVAFGVDWDKRTLSRTNKPETDFIDSVYRFKTDLDMVVLTSEFEEDFMGTQDEHVYENICDGIIAMLWERETEKVPENKRRIVFRYGMLLEEVVMSLEDREITLEKVKGVSV